VRLSDDEVHDELVTLLIAGHETTAASLAWAFELLLQNQPVLERLRDSLAAGEDEYLDAVVKETLRLRPAASGIGRFVREEPLALDGYVVPTGTEVTASIECIHRRSDLFPEPEAFRPERYLGPHPPEAATWIPFGGGVRRCVGAAFASYEMATTIRRVLHRTELHPVGPPERSRPRGITPPTRLALARALRRGRRPLPGRSVRVEQVRPPRPRIG
jgi:cytochrome P450